MANPLVEARRAMTAAAIALNPTPITIHRTTKSRLGAGFDESETDLPPITGRIFLGRPLQQDRTESSPRGTEQAGDQWYLLVPHDADVRADEDTVDRCDFGEMVNNDDVLTLLDGAQLYALDGSLVYLREGTGEFIGERYEVTTVLTVKLAGEVVAKQCALKRL
jgi:hypothetical protein